MCAPLSSTPSAAERPSNPRTCKRPGTAATRISTTVDKDLLDSARRARATANDAELIDEALAALLARDRAAETDAAYATAYAEHPLEVATDCR
ncbi:MAG TPA: hypothetical protein VES40_01560 [Ilumatobacteraceae bacterium]|nr:hypothetical protein [Ilumatobacteraceae bacterium]